MKNLEGFPIVFLFKMHNSLKEDMINRLLDKSSYKLTTKKNILIIYHRYKNGKEFGRNDVTELLNCAGSTAGDIIVKLKELQLVQAVSGKGKGKYIIADDF